MAWIFFFFTVHASSFLCKFNIAFVFLCYVTLYLPIASEFSLILSSFLFPTSFRLCQYLSSILPNYYFVLTLRSSLFHPLSVILFSRYSSKLCSHQSLLSVYSPSSSLSSITLSPLLVHTHLFLSFLCLPLLLFYTFLFLLRPPTFSIRLHQLISSISPFPLSPLPSLLPLSIPLLQSIPLPFHLSHSPLSPPFFYLLLYRGLPLTSLHPPATQGSRKRPELAPFNFFCAKGTSSSRRVCPGKSESKELYFLLDWY